MQNYQYTARDDFGKVVRGRMIAEDETDLANKISKLGYFMVRSKVIAATAKAARPSRLKPRDVLNFTIHLATMLDAGVPLVAALRDLARDAEREEIQRIIDDLRFRVESGSSFKEALVFHSRSFSNLYVGVVGAGESTGRIVPCLNDLSTLLEWQLDLKAKIKEAATYPIILFSVMLGVVILLVVKVIPTFEPIFQDAGVDLPLPTQIVLGISHMVRQYWYIFVGIVILSVAGYRFYYSKPTGRYMIDGLKLRFPLFGLLLRKVAISRFCHTFTLALKAGVNVLAAMDIAREVIGNTRLEHAVAKARDSVNVGEKIATSLQISGEIPPMVIRMIGVGEQSGALPLTLDKVNQFYDREVPATIRRIFALFEPMMIVVMGLIVGVVALSIFLPLFQMAQLIEK